MGPRGSSVGTVVGSPGGWGLDAGGFDLIEAAAVAVHLEDVDVVGEAVEQRPGEALGAEHLGPLVERQVGR